jgi:hypothetical protein
VNGGAADGSPTGWITLHKLPLSDTGTNCNEGGGGTADCHDNSIAYQWCKRIPLNEDFATVHTIQIRLASKPFAGSDLDQTVFIEKASVYVDTHFGTGAAGCAKGS